MAINPQDGITVTDAIGATARSETVSDTPVWLPQEERT
jgi:hypothetical protein